MRPRVRFDATRFEDLAPHALHDLLKLRSDVFILEQGITTEADIDGFDPSSVHVTGRTDEDRLVATARLRPLSGGVKVERVVVVRDLRGRGIGRDLMTFIHARLGERTGVLSAQVHQLRWYEALGWRPEGAVYDEGGVEHRRMVRRGVESA